MFDIKKKKESNKKSFKWKSLNKKYKKYKKYYLLTIYKKHYLLNKKIHNLNHRIFLAKGELAIAERDIDISENVLRVYAKRNLLNRKGWEGVLSDNKKKLRLNKIKIKKARKKKIKCIKMCKKIESNIFIINFKFN